MLAGPIPTEIGKLEDLTQLYLNSNELRGTLCFGLVGPSLEIVQLWSHVYIMMAGSIPTEICGLKLMTFLTLDQLKRRYAI
jgi:Leucine-rich repeat (LRR) protein